MTLNTKQLTVLWYACITAACVFLYQGIDQPRSRPWSFLLSIGVLAAAFIFTFAPHPAARKKVVAACVLTPLLLIIGALAYGIYRTQQAQQRNPFAGIPDIIDPKDVELFEMTLKPSPYYPSTSAVVGRVRNKSSTGLHQFDLWVQLYQAGEKADSVGVRVTFNPPVPSGEAKSFEAEVKGLRFPAQWTWKYEPYNALGPGQ